MKKEFSLSSRLANSGIQGDLEELILGEVDGCSTTTHLLVCVIHNLDTREAGSKVIQIHVLSLLGKTVEQIVECLCRQVIACRVEGRREKGWNGGREIQAKV